MSLSAKRLLALLSAPRSRLYSTLLHPPAPSPPRLPPHLQAEFESLQRAAAVAESTEEVHPDARRGQAKPEFEGDVNPKTGEVGGPKNDPLRYGDWSFNGRVTDF